MSGPSARTHNSCVNWEEKVPALSGWQLITKQNAHRPVLLRQDCRPQVVRIRVGSYCIVGCGAVRQTTLVRAVIQLDVSPQLGRRKIGMQLLRIFDQGDLVGVRSRVLSNVGSGHRDVVPKVICIGRSQARQGIHKFPYAA